MTIYTISYRWLNCEPFCDYLVEEINFAEINNDLTQAVIVFIMVVVKERYKNFCLRDLVDLDVETKYVVEWKYWRQSFWNKNKKLQILENSEILKTMKRHWNILITGS